MVIENLKFGRRNAITSEDLCKIIGLDSISALRQAVKRERLNGLVISSSPEGGYFIPGNKEELQEFIELFEGRAMSMLSSLQSAKDLLHQIEATQGLYSCEDYYRNLHREKAS